MTRRSNTVLRCLTVSQLLGDQSHDIDIALSDMMGYPFALDFTEFASSRDLEVKPIHKVKENPGQSKHLETAKTTVLGLDLDFVNLRAEEYADSSRIPTKMVREHMSADSMYIRVEFYHRLLVHLCRMRKGVTRQSMRCFTMCTHERLKILRKRLSFIQLVLPKRLIVFEGYRRSS